MINILFSQKKKPVRSCLITDGLEIGLPGKAGRSLLNQEMEGKTVKG